MINTQQKPTKQRSLEDFDLARETRANETLKMKDEQIRILTEQNNKLIQSLEQIEQDTKTIQLEKVALDEEVRILRETNIDAKSNARAAEGALEKIRIENEDRDKQLEVMTQQNGELLRLLEDEEANNARLASECDVQKEQVKEFKGKYEQLEKISKENEDISKKVTYEGYLKSEEVRILKAEIETCKHNNNELKMKTSVEIESLQEQLRVRKEKQYQLLEKIQVQEEIRRQIENQVLGMEEKIRTLSVNKSEAETQLQLEINSKLGQLDANKKLKQDSEIITSENKDLTEKYNKMEHERLRMEVEARESGEKLREMAEKVFQLLERLKLAELGKTRSIEALKKKEQEFQSLKKKNTHLIKENTKEGKAKMKMTLDIKELEEQMRAIKKHNHQLSQKCKDESKLKIREEDLRKEAQEKIKTLNSRLTFLLNKLQSDEEDKATQKEEFKDMEQKFEVLLNKCEQLQQHVFQLDEGEKAHVEKLRIKEDEINALNIKLEALRKITDEQNEEEEKRQKYADLKAQSKGNDVERRLAGGRLRFYVDSKPTLGMVLIKGKCAKDREWLEEKGCNSFLKRVMKHQSPQQLLIQKICELYGIAMLEEEGLNKMKENVKQKDDETNILKKKNQELYKTISDEEDIKRRTLVRYINAVKASVSLGEIGSEKDREEVGGVGAGRIQLMDSNLADEDVHAITASLKGNLSVVELNLRCNKISDNGAEAIASLLSGQSSLRLVDLRCNQIRRHGLKTIAEALERSVRIRHVYVHAGGKIEALGHSETNDLNEKQAFTQNVNPRVSISTVCIVDIRDNDIHKEEVGTQHQDMKNSMTSSNTATVPLNNKTLTDYISDTQIRKKVDKARKKANEHLNKDERERKRKVKQMQEAIEKENIKREQGWVGRSGGLDASINTAIEKTKNTNKNLNNSKRQQELIALNGGFPPVRPKSAECIERKTMGYKTSTQKEVHRMASTIDVIKNNEKIKK